MNGVMRGILFLLALMPMLIGSARAQQAENSPLQVDTFGQISCEDSRARADAFMAELSNDPDDRGSVIAYPGSTSALSTFRWLQDFLAQVRFRNFDMKRLDVVIGPVRKDKLIEFWRVPPGIDAPKPKPSDLEPRIARPTVKKPTWFGSTISSEESGCVSMPFDIEAFSIALRNLQGVRGRITVKGPNANNALKRQRELLAEMRGFGIEEPAVRTTFEKSRREVTELWIEPIP